MLSLRAHFFQVSVEPKSSAGPRPRPEPLKQLTFLQMEAMTLLMDWPSSVNLRSDENCMPIWLRSPLCASHGSHVES